MKRWKIFVALAFGAATTGLSAGVWAHSGATGIVKQRMDGMKAMGHALATIGDMFKGKFEFNPAHVARSARIVKEHASSIGMLFPDTEASRNGSATEALTVIWERPDEFRTLAKELADRATALEATAATGDKREIRTDFAKLSRTCAACHTEFRKPKK